MLLEAIRRSALRQGDKPAYRCGTARLSYRQLWSGALRLAAALKAQGAGPVLVWGHKEPAVPLSFLACLLALQAPWTDWSEGWSGGLDELVHYGAYEYYNTMLDYDPWLMEAYSPWGGLALTGGLHLLAYTALGLILFAFNCLTRSRLGFLPCTGLLLWDAVMEEYFMENVYYFSPVTLCRLTALDYGDEMGRPPAWYAAVVLAVLVGILAWVCVGAARRKELTL